jgi:5-methylcytosine-specific restriction endonuclease McrA
MRCRNHLLGFSYWSQIMSYYKQYSRYINSAEWKSLRNQVIKRDKGTCQKCGSKSFLTVHHFSYPQNLGNETLDTLITWCEDCHNIHHGGKSKHRTNDGTSKRRYKFKSGVGGPVKRYTKEEIAAYYQSIKL